ncbi:hypothetical protein DFH06DRAFT_990108 [Mycena polygramma]|nr:hypothetical protein DFH06DRAFT_990108 [Mycena polygramma]
MSWAAPLLPTPSGSAFAVRVRVRRISTDPPCIMPWPENEPFPDQGQIRPSEQRCVSASIDFISIILLLPEPALLSSHRFLTRETFMYVFFPCAYAQSTRLTIYHSHQAIGSARSAIT